MAGSPVRLRESSVEEFLQCRQAARLISVEDGIRTAGALLFAFRDSKARPVDPSSFWPSHRHVSFLLGDSAQTIEAFGANGEGVAIKGLRLGTDAAGRSDPRFNFAALAPGVTYPGFNGEIGGGGGGGAVAAVGAAARWPPVTGLAPTSGSSRRG